MPTMDEAQKSAHRRRTCLILSGGLLECAGTIRRVRWALDTDLAPEVRAWLDAVEGDLFTHAASAETEAAFYLAVHTPHTHGPECAGEDHATIPGASPGKDGTP